MRPRWPRRSSCRPSTGRCTSTKPTRASRTPIATERPFLERLTQFWTNHFAVSIDKIVVLGLAGAMEREAIRPHVTGHFTDLLLAVEQHPAMLLYLDNQASDRAELARGAVRRRGAAMRAAARLGINENLAREILELHTLGVDGGYTQADVTTFAQAISRLVDRRRRTTTGGSRGSASTTASPANSSSARCSTSPAPKRLLGKSYAEDGVRQGEAILADLALRRETARHISTKLARHFIADDPPPRRRSSA